MLSCGVGSGSAIGVGSGSAIGCEVGSGSAIGSGGTIGSDESILLSCNVAVIVVGTVRLKEEGELGSFLNSFVASCRRVSCSFRNFLRFAFSESDFVAGLLRS